LVHSLGLAGYWEELKSAAPEVTFSAVRDILLFLVLRLLINRIAWRAAQPIIRSQEHLLGHSAGYRARTIAGLIRSVGNYALFFVFLILLLRDLRFDAVSVITAASFASIAFGFGAQKLVKDVIQGFFILVENQYGVGEYVTINSVSGKVEDVGMRITRIRDDAGRLYILSNGDISTVCNLSRGDTNGTIEIAVAVGMNATMVTDVLNKVGEELISERDDLGLLSAPKVLGITGEDGTRVTLKMIVNVSNTVHLGDAQLELRARVHAALRREGIKLAP
jgi:small conductance mechanosensitive channel